MRTKQQLQKELFAEYKNLNEKIAGLRWFLSTGGDVRLLSGDTIGLMDRQYKAMVEYSDALIARAENLNFEEEQK